jgi:hypothetical protein
MVERTSFGKTATEVSEKAVEDLNENKICTRCNQKCNKGLSIENKFGLFCSWTCAYGGV